MGEYMYFWKGVSESRVETYYSSIIFGCQQKIKTHVYYIHLLLTKIAWRQPITFSLWKRY